MSQIVVTTLAGSGEQRSTNGFGTAASLHAPTAICYCATDDSLLITEAGSHRIRRVFPATEQRKSALNRILRAVLIESGALPVQPLLSIIFDFALTTKSIAPS